MPIDLHQLPDDVDARKSLLAEQLVRIEQLHADKQAVEQKNEHLTARVFALTEQLNLALARRYAASSEERLPDQIRLFDEAELDSTAEPDAVTEASTHDDEVTVAAH